MSPQTGHPASAQDPANWSDEPKARAAAAALAARTGARHAIGFALTDRDPFWCLDIDNCRTSEGQWSPQALELLGKLPGAAVEVSQSGNGLHVWGRGTLPPHACKADGLELYDRARFIVIGEGLTAGSQGATGSIAAECPGIAEVVSHHFQPRPGAEAAANDPGLFDGPCPEWRGPAADAELIARAQAQPRNPQREFQGRPHFSDLWNANADALARAYPTTSASPYDASQADMALASDLAFWTGRDAPRIERLMRQSALVREKWDYHPAYLPGTIAKACQLKAQVLQDAPLTSEAPPPDAEARFPLVAFADVETNPPAPQRWAWDQLVPAGEVTLLGAHGGTGKSWLALELAAHVAMGWPMFGRDTTEGHAVFLSAEDGPDTVRRRLRGVCRGLDLDPQALGARLQVWDGTQADPALFAGERGRPGAVTEAGRAFAAKLAQVHPGLVVVDNASDAYAGDEIDRRDVRAFVQFLARTVRPWGGAVLLLAHVSKTTSRAGSRPEDSESYSGSTAWHNSCRSRLFLLRGEGGVLELRREKSNHAATPCSPMRFTGVLGGARPVLLDAPAQVDPAAAQLALLDLLEREHVNAQERGRKWARLAPTAQSADDAIKALRGLPGWPAGISDREAREFLKNAERTGTLLKIAVPGENRKKHDTWIPAALWQRHVNQSAPGAPGAPG